MYWHGCDFVLLLSPWPMHGGAGYAHFASTQTMPASPSNVRPQKIITEWLLMRF
jgi:hypothetical protein